MRAIDEKPRAVRERIAVQTVGAETLLYDERRHMAFCLNESAGVVWRLADGTRTVAEITLAASDDLGAELGEDLVRLALQTLNENGLLEAGIPAESAQLSTVSNHCGRVSRRSMLRMGVGAAALLPVVASIVAPTAAQAYSGCVDCSVAGPRGARRAGGTPGIAPLSDPGQ